MKAGMCAIWALVATFATLSSGQDSSLDDLIKKEYEDEDVDHDTIVFGGSVGKLKAIFILDWFGLGEVNGKYYHPSRGRDRHYVVKGQNPEQGLLLLTEYTPKPGGKLVKSATFRLTEKPRQAGRFVWQGTARNTDGRVFQVTMFTHPIP